MVVVLAKKLMYSGKVVVIGQGGCTQAKWLYSHKSACIRQGCYIRANMVVVGQKWSYSGKVVVFRQKWLYSGKVVVFGQK